MNTQSMPTLSLNERARTAENVQLIVKLRKQLQSTWPGNQYPRLLKAYTEAQASLTELLAELEYPLESPKLKDASTTTSLMHVSLEDLERDRLCGLLSTTVQL